MVPEKKPTLGLDIRLQDLVDNGPRETGIEKSLANLVQVQAGYYSSSSSSPVTVLIASSNSPSHLEPTTISFR